MRCPFFQYGHSAGGVRYLDTLIDTYAAAACYLVRLGLHLVDMRADTFTWGYPNKVEAERSAGVRTGQQML